MLKSVLTLPKILFLPLFSLSLSLSLSHFLSVRSNSSLMIDFNQRIFEITPSFLPPLQMQNNMVPNPNPPFMFPQKFQQGGTSVGYPQVGGEDLHSQLTQLQKHNMQFFWNQRMLEICNITEFKSHHQLPLARIKKIMKADEGVKMIRAETPLLFSKACELFIMDLTHRAWIHTEAGKRRTLQRNDIAKVIISQGEVLDFLSDIVPLQPPKLETSTRVQEIPQQFVVEINYPTSKETSG